MLDLEKFVAGVHDYIARALRPFAEKVAALEARQPERGEKGDKGDPGERGLPGEHGAAGRDGVDGKDGVPGERGEKGEQGEAGSAGRDGVDGKDGLPGERGEKGEKGDPGERGDRGEKGETGKSGRDGVDGRSVTIEDIRPWLESKQAEWALDFERRAHATIQSVIDKMPRPKDGRDGLNLEDFQLTQSEDGRTITLGLVRGETRVERSFVLHHPIYQGVWKAGDYRKGDCVTWGGSQWIALTDTSAKPETDDSWKLSVKRGRDGKDGAKGDAGPPGKNGRDFTRLGTSL